MEDRSRTQVYYGRLLRVNLHRFRTEPRDYLALIRDIIKTFERVLFGPVIRGSWPNYYIKCWNTAVTTLAIKRAPAKLAERFGAYNGHPYPFMLLPPTFHRRGRPYNTRAFQFTKTKKERKKEREERDLAGISLHIYQSLSSLRFYNVHLGLLDTCVFRVFIVVRKEKEKKRMYASPP